MACTISIPFWPASTDCLDWSADNQIVVTGGEQVAILIPRLKERGPNGRLWDTTVIKVNAFTEKELPFRDPPLSTANFSVGEDLSCREAIEAKWSPPRLARHKGCALAILSANHVLSIWAPDGRADVAGNWKRRVVVNHAIAEYYESNTGLQQNGTSSQLSEDQLEEWTHVRQRIRSFAWSPSLVRDGEAFGDEEHYLAVSTEGGDILFLQVVSPSSAVPTRISDWDITVVGSLHLETHLKNLPRNDQDFCMADYLCWNEWQIGDTGSRSANFAYVCCGRLFTASIKRDHNTEALEKSSHGFAVDMSKMHMHDRTDVTGPIRFVPGDQAGSLIAFGVDTVFQVDLDGDADSFRTHHLDGRWDGVSGVAFTNPGDGSTLVHITSLLSMSTATTTTLSLPLEEDEESVQPSWQHAISETRTVYGTDHDLDGHVLERTAGIASSPMYDYIATCTTMHPSDCVEYVIVSDQTSTLNITWETESSESNILPAPFATAGSPSSSEALLFSLVRQLERRAELDEAVEVDQELLREELLHCSPFHKNVSPTSDLHWTQPVNGSPEGICHHLKRVFNAHPDVLAAQASRIVDMALKPNMPRAEISRPVVSQLVRQFLKLPTNSVVVDHLSDRIKATFALISAKLSLPEQAATNGSKSNNSESCKICQKPIPFEALRWAKCSSGHQFSRCALSFLPIQEPGTTKSCGMCGLQYLMEKVFSDTEPTADDIEMADVPSAEGNIDAPANDTWVEVSRHPNAFPQRTRTLAQILFAACDLCIYCGGQFVD